MKRTSVRNFMAIIAVLGLLAVSIGVLGAEFIARAAPAGNIPLKGNTVPLVMHANRLGPTDGHQQLSLSIGLQPRNQDELNTLLSELYTPGSSMYHQFLTPAEFAAEFGPSPDQQQQVVSYLRGLGFHVTSISPNGLLIDATTSVTQAEKGLQVKINNYRAGSHTFYANASAPLIPASLDAVINSIGGLDTSVKIHPLDSDIRLSPRGNQGSHGGYAPADLRGAYDANPLISNGIQGSNQTVAVFELDGYQKSDITNYLNGYNLGNPSITNVLVDGFNGAAGQNALEDELDIEVVAAMAPQAAQIVYEGPNTTQGVNDTYNKIVTDHKAQIMTTSWGACEALTGTTELQTLDNIFKQGATQGITMYAASGDSGAYDCGDSKTLNVDNPADDPYVTGVGGTTLILNNGGYGSETVWNNGYGADGGGLSTYFSLPSWQTGPGVQNKYSNGKREVPDVSADADPNTGYSVYCTVAFAGCGLSGWTIVGGTSGAAPLWAGSTALINQYLLQQGKTRMGSGNPVLYGLENAQQSLTPYHDITSGNNLYYPATAGYDMASGWGSPDIYSLAQDIANGTSSNPTPTPTATNTPTPTPTPTNTPTPTPTPITPANLIQNGGFENGVSPWVEYSAGGYQLIDTTNPHSGRYSAYLCGYSRCDDSIKQSFVVPTNAPHIYINYWWYETTRQISTSCVDTFTVSILNSSGAVIGRIQSACNTNARNMWLYSSNDVTQMLATYAGQVVTLMFEGKTSSSWFTTSFFVDDVSGVVSSNVRQGSGESPNTFPVELP